jgi:hypothetical protein
VTTPPPPPPPASYSPPAPPAAQGYTVPPSGATYAPAAQVAAPGAHLREVLAGLDQETLRPTFIVAGVILGIWLVTQVLGAIAPAAAGQTGQTGSGANQGGTYVTIGSVKFGLLSGWHTGTSQTANGRVTNGVVIIDIYSYNFTGAPIDLYNQYNADQQKSSTNFKASDAAPVSPNGLTGVRGTYFGNFSVGKVDGELTVVTVGGKGYVFDAWATGGLLDASLPQVEQMLSTLQLSQ